MNKLIRILLFIVVLCSLLTACRKQKAAAPETTVPETQAVAETTVPAIDPGINIYPPEIFDDELAEETTAKTAAPSLESTPAPTQISQEPTPSATTAPADDSAGDGNFGSEIFD